ncbi:leucine rich repeat protein [Blastocystis sp. ATCC 50177/Nand II]|uniref:Leucine rich repeat protein n=1 Tax=Blastocystis sp. subtype 1 (strain ATCC 50177 / NandII) TaxID=478820 RepID=A0A196SIR8_BLAHN|nr:leucine rich repeat protein [Blastocystis sp. ATCC 50177/Nand II]
MSGISSQDKGEHAKGEYNPEEMESKVEILNADTIRTVLTEDLASYTGSKLVNLSKLGITKLESLSGLDHANRIDLSYNKLKSIRALEPLKELTFLNLSYNMLSGKGIRGILLLDRLVFLNLGNNRIGVIPDFAFVKMVNLKCLLLNNNKLESIEFVSSLHQLNTLVLSGNAISSISKECFSSLTSLRKLSLGHNELREFPPVFHITSLKELNLNSNKISSIPDAITKLVHLTQLDLGNNLLENVKVLSVFARMTTLTKLNVAHNLFYTAKGTDEASLEKVTSVIKSMLPHLVTLNNHQLQLGKENRECRKRHYEERSALSKEKEEKKENRMMREKKKEVKKNPKKETQKEMKEEKKEVKKEIVKKMVNEEKKETQKEMKEEKKEVKKEIDKKEVKEEKKEDVEKSEAAAEEMEVEKGAFQTGVVEVEKKDVNVDADAVASFLKGEGGEVELDGNASPTDITSRVSVSFNVDEADWMPPKVKDVFKQQQALHIDEKGNFSLISSLHRSIVANRVEVMRKLQKKVNQACMSTLDKHTIGMVVDPLENEKRLKEKHHRSELSRKRRRQDKDYDIEEFF